LEEEPRSAFKKICSKGEGRREKAKSREKGKGRKREVLPGKWKNFIGRPKKSSPRQAGAQGRGEF